MKRIVSWVHFIGCLGWSLCWVFLLFSEESWLVVEGEGLLVTVPWLLTVGSGIYLFLVGSNRQLSQLWEIKTENRILQAKLEQSQLQRQLTETETGDSVTLAV